MFIDFGGECLYMQIIVSLDTKFIDPDDLIRTNKINVI